VVRGRWYAPPNIDLPKSLPCTRSAHLMADGRRAQGSLPNPLPPPGRQGQAGPETRQVARWHGGMCIADCIYTIYHPACFKGGREKKNDDSDVPLPQR
jgi:hypothetical protein